MHVPPHQICEEALLNIYDFYKNHPSEVRKMEKTYAFAEGLDPHDRYADLKIRYPEYLRMCNDWITQRGIHDNRFQNVDYGAYAQDDKTYDQITEAMGHAVRANLWYSSFARIGGYTGNADYVKAAKTLWDNIVKKQMYVTGGTGARGESFGEDYAGNYMLPQNGYCETCASVAMAFYADNMFSVFGDAQYQDILELEMYNGILGSLSLKGNAFYYQNPLVSQDYERPSWSGLTPCCPPMYMKFFGFLPSYIYSVRSDNLYVNQYIGSVATCKVGKTKVKLTQKTDMPNGRKASFAVSGTGRFTLKLRRPSWAKGVLLTVCGQTKPAKAGADGYINIDRTWNDGDTVSVEFEKVVERLYQNKVVYNRGQVAIKYGPFVYCAESEDNPFTGGMTFDSVIFALPKGNSFKAHLDNQAFRIEYNGKAVPLAVVTLKSTVQLKSNGSITKQPLKLVPFFVRGNRNNRGMKVWLNEEKNK